MRRASSVSLIREEPKVYFINEKRHRFTWWIRRAKNALKDEKSQQSFSHEKCQK
jgi:hypothetical protein